MIKDVKVNPVLSFEKLSGLISRADDLEKIAVAENWLKANTAITSEQAKTLEITLKGAEAKIKIATEFVEGFHQWLKDWDTLSDDEYGKKYGYGRGKEKPRDSFNSVKVYMEYFFCGRYITDWEKEGYEKQVIWQLHHEGFLSLKEYSNYQARMKGKTSFYYIPQRTAKEIYKSFKAKHSA